MCAHLTWITYRRDVNLMVAVFWRSENSDGVLAHVFVAVEKVVANQDRVTLMF